MASRAAAVLLVALLGAAAAIPVGADSSLSLRKVKKKFYTKKLADQLFLTQQEADALYAGSAGQRLVWSAPDEGPQALTTSYAVFDSLTVPAGTWLLQATMNFVLNTVEPGTNVAPKPSCRLVGPQDAVLASAPAEPQSLSGPRLASTTQALVTTSTPMLVRVQCRDSTGNSSGSTVDHIRVAATSFEPQDVTED